MKVTIRIVRQFASRMSDFWGKLVEDFTPVPAAVIMPSVVLVMLVALLLAIPTVLVPDLWRRRKCQRRKQCPWKPETCLLKCQRPR